MTLQIHSLGIGDIRKLLDQNSVIYLTQNEFKPYRDSYVDRILQMGILQKIIIAKTDEPQRDEYICENPRTAIVFDKYNSKEQLIGAILRIAFRDYKDIEIHKLNNKERKLMSLKFHLDIEDIDMRSSLLSVLSLPWIIPDSNISIRIIDSLKYILDKYDNRYIDYYRILLELKLKHRVETFCYIFNCDEL
ncbi:MAG: hypothetical protein QXD03_01410 [Candidatus Anstonellales archaeon]